MLETTKALFTGALLVLGTAEVSAQGHVEMPHVGLSVEIPDSWGETSQWDVVDQAPAMALYHVQEDASGKFVAIRRDECKPDEQKRAWVSGELTRGHLSDEDVLKPLPEDAPVRFGSHAGFLHVAPREAATNHLYVFYWIEGDGCYKVDVGGPEETFTASAAEFQGVLDSIEPME